jgi:hypothetical protein
MAGISSGEAAKPYLDYLDKEMTIQGILSAFCIAAAAAIFDRILAADSRSALIQQLQNGGRPFVLGAVTALIVAASFFYLQRSRLAWLHGQISFAATCEMQNLVIPSDTNSLMEGLSIGNSWSLWNCYKFGMSFLALTAVEASCGIYRAIAQQNATPSIWLWLSAGGLFLITALIDVVILLAMGKRDQQSPLPRSRAGKLNSGRAIKERN